jgi:hypothetical protein
MRRSLGMLRVVVAIYSDITNNLGELTTLLNYFNILYNNEINIFNNF